MSASNADRTRASRIRRVTKAGTVKPHETEWLRAYEAARSERAIPRAVRAAPPAPAQLVQQLVQEDDDDDDDDDDEPSDREVSIDFGKPQAEGTELAPTAPRCTIPDCPACRGMASGSLTCVVTGKRVWPPMSDSGSKALAGVILAAISFLARYMRKDKAVIVPTDTERDELAKALREAILRRASFVSAVDDLFALAFHVGKYGRRAFMAPAPKGGELAAG